MIRKALVLGLVGVFSAGAFAERTPTKQVRQYSETSFGSTRDMANFVGAAAINADTCPADDLGLLVFTGIGDGWILEYPPTCGGTDAFDGSAGCGDGAYGEGNGGLDQIAKWTVDTDGVYSWDTCTIAAGYDSSLMIREETGGGCPGDEIACDGDSCNVGNFESGLEVFLNAGTTYYGVLDGWADTECSDVPTPTVIFLIALPCEEDADCDDGVVCNGPETCSGGLCVAGVYPCESYQTCDDVDGCLDPEDCVVWQGDPNLPGSFSPQCFNGCLGSGLADDWEFARDGQLELISYNVMTQARNVIGAAAGCTDDEPLDTDYFITTYLATVDPATGLVLEEIPGTRCENVLAGQVLPGGSGGDVTTCAPNGGLPTGVILPDGDQFDECGVDVYMVLISHNQGAGLSLGTQPKLIGGPGATEDFGIAIMAFEDCDPETGLPLGTWGAGAFSAPTITDARNGQMCTVPSGTCCSGNNECSAGTEADCDALGGSFNAGSAANGYSEDCGDDPDGDGVVDLCGGDNCPDDANSDQVDSDGDGLGDACDACPNDANNDADDDGACCGAGEDECCDDPNKTEEGQCGCGIADTDDDGDGVSNCNDQCNGVDDAVFAPECVDAIPTVSQWGLVVLALLLLVAGKVYYGRRQATA